jgi:hypothetical protein
VGRKARPRKKTDDETEFWCAGGVGVREEVWVDERDLVVRYNLAFILPIGWEPITAAFLASTTHTVFMSAITWAT